MENNKKEVSDNFGFAVTGRAEGARGVYENWDFNQDGKITIEEARQKP